MTTLNGLQEPEPLVAGSSGQHPGAKEPQADESLPPGERSPAPAKALPRSDMEGGGMLPSADLELIQGKMPRLHSRFEQAMHKTTEAADQSVLLTGRQESKLLPEKFFQGFPGQA